MTKDDMTQVQAIIRLEVAGSGPARDTDNKPQITVISMSYRVAFGAQQGQKAFMIRTVRPLDRPNSGLARVAQANGYSLHSGECPQSGAGEADRVG